MTTAIVALSIWAICCATFIAAEHRWHTRQRVLRLTPPYLANVPVPAPTTPPLSQTVASADWFWGIPADCLGDDAIRALADDIERREFS